MGDPSLGPPARKGLGRGRVPSLNMWKLSECVPERHRPLMQGTDTKDMAECQHPPPPT